MNTKNDRNRFGSMSLRFGRAKDYMVYTPVHSPFRRILDRNSIDKILVY